MSATPSIAFSHIGIHCFDLEKMVGFYTGCLGMSETDRGKLQIGDGTIEIVFLSADPKDHHQIALVGQPPRTVEPGAALLNQIAFRVDSLAGLRTLQDALRAEGITQIRPISHGNAWSIYFPDPEGNNIEAFVDSPWYVRQPVADPLDLSLSDDEIFAATQERFGNDPTFKPAEEWRGEFARRLAASRNELGV